MSSYGNDVYSNPEKHGLAIVADLDEDGLSYEFHMLVVWRHEDGRLFYQEDGGCSCPSPFEDCMSLDDLIEITPAKWADFEREVMAFPATGVERHDLIRAAREARA